MATTAVPTEEGGGADVALLFGVELQVAGGGGQHVAGAQRLERRVQQRQPAARQRQPVAPPRL